MALDEKNLAGVGPVGAGWYFFLGHDGAGRAISVRAAGSDDHGKAGTRAESGAFHADDNRFGILEGGRPRGVPTGPGRDDRKSNRITCRFGGHGARDESAARGKEQLQTRSRRLENG